MLLDALARMEALQKTDGIAETNWDLAKLYRAKNSLSQAQSHFDRAHQLYTQLGAKADLAKIDREWNGETWSYAPNNNTRWPDLVAAIQSVIVRFAES